MVEGSPGAEPGKRLADLEAKLAELRQVNAELGRELRRGPVSRRPRSPLAAARALAKLTNERDMARAELDETAAKLASVEEGFKGLRLEAERLRHEVGRLRSGLPGMLRRARARLLLR